jgi:hypothetical protein
MSCSAAGYMLCDQLYKMKNTFSHLLLFLCLSSCSSHKDTAEKEPTVTDAATVNSTATRAINKDTIKYTAADTSVHISLDKNNPATTITGKLEGKAQVIQLYIDKRSSDSVDVLIKPSDPDANIRLNQVIYPGGTADGPFGREQKFALKKSGVYKLIIGNDLMAEGKTRTAFTLHLSIH